MISIYDNKPLIYGANGDGSYTYRWNITEVEVPTGDETGATIQQWQCHEVVVWNTVTKDKLTEAVITTLWDNDYEAKLINDYNAAKEGVFGSASDSVVQEYISRYKNFLMERKATKERIAADCKTLNII